MEGALGTDTTGLQRFIQAARVQSCAYRWVRRKVPRNSGVPRTRKNRRQADKNGRLSWDAVFPEPQGETSTSAPSWGESGAFVSLQAIRRESPRH